MNIDWQLSFDRLRLSSPVVAWRRGLLALLDVVQSEWGNSDSIARSSSRENKMRKPAHHVGDGRFYL